MWSWTEVNRHFVAVYLCSGAPARSTAMMRRGDAYSRHRDDIGEALIDAGTEHLPHPHPAPAAIGTVRIPHRDTTHPASAQGIPTV